MKWTSLVFLVALLAACKPPPRVVPLLECQVFCQDRGGIHGLYHQQYFSKSPQYICQCEDASSEEGLR